MTHQYRLLSAPVFNRIDFECIKHSYKKWEQTFLYYLSIDIKAKIALAVVKKVYANFPRMQEFIDKAYVEECCKENISVDEVFF